MRVNRIAIVATLAVFAAGVAAAAIKVQVDHNPAFDFSTLHAWTWHPKGPGNAVKIITADDDSSAFKARIEPRLLSIVEDELQRKGFPTAQGGSPDFHMTYYVLVTVGDSSQSMGQFVGNVPEWGLPPLVGATTSLEIYPRGSLILDVTSVATGEVVWRGIAQAELKWDEAEPKRDQRVRDAVRQLFKKFPPKTTKKPSS
jgi:hypothetical protein